MSFPHALDPPKGIAIGRHPPTWDAADLERQLLRRGVGALAADRHACADCGRTPLVGERIHRYDQGEVVCELCRPDRRRDPVSAETVRHSESGHTVRVRRAA